jgi:TolB-like protein/class 3 adenylate cyclase/Flp pilus assembly protein TadD
MHADVVGSTHLVHLDETLAHERIRDTFQRFTDTIRLYNGVAHEIRGDALVAEFHMASDAVSASLAFQEANKIHLDELKDDVRPVLRIGITMGEVVVADHTVTGDGVVLAQRLEQLAEPGGVVIQGAAHETVPKRLPFDYEDMGELELKGFEERVRAFAVRLRHGESVPRPESRDGPDMHAPDLSDVPASTGQFRPLHAVASRRNKILAGSMAVLIAIAGVWIAVTTTSGEHAAESNAAQQPSKNPSLVVLPFANKSDDKAQDYFVDGITEDIITDLSRLSNLTVIAWNTSSSFKGKTVQPHEAGKELGVGYILDGSVRKSGDQLRITAQLVDASNGKQLWAERYDRKLADVFALQDEVTKKIVQALAVRLTAAEKGQLGHSGTSNLAAYDALLQGLQYFRQRNKEGNELARAAYRRAIELDPGYGRAYGALAITHTYESTFGYSELLPDEARERALELAQKAVALDNSSPEVYWALGFVHLFRKEYDKAEAAATQAVALSPNYADGYGLLAFINNWQGKADDAARYISKAMTLNPYYTYDYPWNLGLAHYLLGQYAEATKALQDALARNESAILPRLFLASCYVRLGRQEDAEWEIEQAMIQSPETRLSQLASTLPLKNREKLTAFLADLRKAGMPDR